MSERTRRLFLLGIIGSSLGMWMVGESPAAAPREISVQLRVYRQPRPGRFEFIPNIPVTLYRNGVLVGQGLTGSHPRHAVTIKNLPPTGRYTAKALVGRSLIDHTNIEPFQGVNLRANFVL